MLEREYRDLKEAAEINPEIWDVHRQVGILYGLASLREGEEQRAALVALHVAVQKRARLIEEAYSDLTAAYRP